MPKKSKIKILNAGVYTDFGDDELDATKEGRKTFARLKKCRSRGELYDLLHDICFNQWPPDGCVFTEWMDVNFIDHDGRQYRLNVEPYYDGSTLILSRISKSGDFISLDITNHNAKRDQIVDCTYTWSMIYYRNNERHNVDEPKLDIITSTIHRIRPKHKHPILITINSKNLNLYIVLRRTSHTYYTIVCLSELTDYFAKKCRVPQKELLTFVERTIHGRWLFTGWSLDDLPGKTIKLD